MNLIPVSVKPQSGSCNSLLSSCIHSITSTFTSSFLVPNSTIHSSFSSTVTGSLPPLSTSASHINSHSCNRSPHVTSNVIGSNFKEAQSDVSLYTEPNKYFSKVSINLSEIGESVVLVIREETFKWGRSVHTMNWVHCRIVFFLS